MCRGPLWPPADRVLFNTQSTVLTFPPRHKAHRACGTTPCIWFYWSRALGPRPCWHAQIHCSIMDRLRRGLQHRGQIAGPTGQHTTSSDEQMNMWYCDPLASMTSCSIRTVLFSVIFEVLIYWSNIVQGKWGVMEQATTRLKPVSSMWALWINITKMPKL